MLVYPHGCVEVEQFVLFLCNQLHLFGIKVLSDITQSERIAEQGLANVLTDNFNEADYVVTLLFESTGRFSSSIPYVRKKYSL